MGIPFIEALNSDRVKLSDEAGFTSTNIYFTFNEPVQSYTVNSLGVSYDTGTVLESGSKNINNLKILTVQELKSQTVKSIREYDEEIQVEIDYLDLPAEGDNRINIYGQSQETKE